MTRFVGGLLMAIGGLIAGLCGLCTGVYAVVMIVSVASAALAGDGWRALTAMGGAVMVALIVGGVPIAIGTGLFVIGRRQLRRAR